MKVAVINNSAIGMKGQKIYNLAVDRIANFHLLQGDELVYKGGWKPMVAEEADTIYFSVIFTWDIPDLILQVNQVLSWGKQVEIGGPAATFMGNYIEAHTGVPVHRGLDQRFEYIDGEYDMTFTSRGCPHGCDFCGVKRVEPVFVVYDNFPLARMLGDNNLLATGDIHQRRVVDRLKETYPKGKVDINSGFDVRYFKPRHFKLYSELRLLQWRFAFDSMAVEKDVRRVAKLMKANGLDRHKVTYYVLIGFPGQTPEDAFYRLNTIIELGHNPYPMRYWPLNSLDRSYVAPGWTEDLLYRMSMYYQTPYIWMSDSWENFEPGKKIKKIPEEQGSLI